MGAPEFVVVGCSHKTAPLEVRETLVFDPEQVQQALRLARGESVLHETMILSTCNRTEFYSLSPDPLKAEAYVRELISRFKGTDLLGAGPYAYIYRDRDMIRHLFRVAAGLESMVIGEVQILGQVKAAYSLACEQGSTGIMLNRLLASAFRAGRRARAETGIGEGPVSFASAAVALCTRIFSELTEKRVLLVGAGETARLAAQHFAEERPATLMIANRTPARGRALADELHGEVVPYADLSRALVLADIVVTATRSSGIVISEDMTRKAMRERSARPLVFVDMAVPRDVDAAVSRHDNVFLYSLDALQTIMDQSLVRRRKEAPRVETIVEEEVERFLQWSRSLEVTPTVRELRDKFERVRAEEIRRIAPMFPGSDRASLEALSKALLNKFLHLPTTRIKAIDLEADDGLLRLDAVRALFDLGSETASKDPGAADAEETEAASAEDRAKRGNGVPDPLDEPGT